MFVKTKYCIFILNFSLSRCVSRLQNGYFYSLNKYSYLCYAGYFCGVIFLFVLSSPWTRGAPSYIISWSYRSSCPPSPSGRKHFLCLPISSGNVAQFPIENLFKIVWFESSRNFVTLFQLVIFFLIYKNFNCCYCNSHNFAV